MSGGFESGRDVCGEVADRGRQRAEEVVRARVDERAFPVDATVEEVGRLLDGAADLVTAVRGAHSVGVARVVLVASLDAVARQFRGLNDALLPLGEGLGGIVVIEMDPHRRRGVQPASERVGRRSRADADQEQVQDPLVLRRIRVALLDHVVAPGEVAVELAPRPRSARDDQLSVPVVRQPQQEARLARGIAGHAGGDLQPGNGLRDLRAIGWVGRNDGAIGHGGKSEGWQAGDGVVLRRGRRVVRRQVSTLDAGRVGELIAELRQERLARIL